MLHPQGLFNIPYLEPILETSSFFGKSFPSCISHTRGQGEKLSAQLITTVKLRTGNHWVGTRRVLGSPPHQCKAFLSQPMSPWTAYECSAAQSMNPWAATKEALDQCGVDSSPRPGLYPTTACPKVHVEQDEKFSSCPRN